MNPATSDHARLARVATLLALGLLAGGTAAQAVWTVELVSRGQYVSQPLPPDAVDVELVRQLTGACRFNRTWGFDLANREVWVNGGCGGQFRIVTAQGGVAPPGSRPPPPFQPFPPSYPPTVQPGGPPAAARDGTIRTGNGGLCLDMRGDRIQQGASANVFRCHGEVNQQFRWTRRGELMVGGLCLDVANGSRDNGAAVIAWTCNGGGNQRWMASGGRIRNQSSGRCLDVQGGSLRQGTPVVIWDCNNGGNQVWRW